MSTLTRLLLLIVLSVILIWSNRVFAETARVPATPSSHQAQNDGR